MSDQSSGKKRSFSESATNCVVVEDSQPLQPLSQVQNASIEEHQLPPQVIDNSNEAGNVISSATGSATVSLVNDNVHNDEDKKMRYFDFVRVNTRKFAYQTRLDEVLASVARNEAKRFTKVVALSKLLSRLRSIDIAAPIEKAQKNTSLEGLKEVANFYASLIMTVEQELLKTQSMNLLN